MNQLVIGQGQVGLALAELLGCDSRDVADTGELQSTYRLLHICVPWQVENFVEVVQAYDAQYSPEFVIVHATVPTGTCDRHGWVHSPIRGKHPDLLPGLRAFTKHYGGAGAQSVAHMLEEWFPVWETHDYAATTEAGKLFEMVSYGIEIVIQKTVWDYCARMDLPFDEVYRSFSETYNEGWLLLEQHQFVKPILVHVPGPISGHCVIPAAQMLKDHCNDILAQVVLAVNGELK